jgi:DNA recombination protein RmuC
LIMPDWLLIGMGLAGGGILGWLVAIAAKKNSSDWQQAALGLQQAVSERLDRVTSQLDRRLEENAKAMRESKSFLADRVSSTEKTVREVGLSLGKLEQATKALQTTTADISSFQNLLKNPKVRGSFGEVLLNNLLADVLPGDRYATQYAFTGRGDIADAVIKLQDGYIVAIDAKYPLANYEIYVQTADPVLKRKQRTLFMRDVKRHVSEIARKYIVPREQTLDYAFMYIPMEGVYYETMIQSVDGESLWEFCLQQHVVPVSPNSFLAYLQTVLVGLKGMKIEKQAREILEHLSQLRLDFRKFDEDFVTMGKHLTNAKHKYDDASSRLSNFQHRLTQFDSGNPQLPAN